MLTVAALMALPEVWRVETGTAGGGIPPFRMTLQSNQDFDLMVSEGDIGWGASATADVVTKDSSLGNRHGRTRLRVIIQEEGGRQSLRIFAGVWRRVVRRVLSRQVQVLCRQGGYGALHSPTTRVAARPAATIVPGTFRDLTRARVRLSRAAPLLD